MKLRMLTFVLALFVCGCSVNIRQVGTSEKPTEVQQVSSGTGSEKATESEKPGMGSEKATTSEKPGTDSERPTESETPGTGTESKVEEGQILRTYILKEDVQITNRTRLYHSSIKIDDDGYEPLKSSIAKNADSVWKNTLQFFGLSEIDQEAGSGVYYTLSLEPEIMRGDESIFSYFDCLYVDLGGPHPSFATTGYTFDSQSGKLLRLEDVITDKDALRKKVLERLRKINENISLNDSYEQTINNDFKNPDALHWALGSDALKIHFDASHIMPSVAGDLRLEFPYDEYADLFNTKYIPKDKSWTRQIVALEAQVEGNELSLSIDEDEEGDYTTIAIQYAKQTYKEKLVGGRPAFWLMHLSKGKNFLCIEMRDRNDYYAQTYVYALKPAGIARTMDMPSGIVAAPSPKCVAMKTSMDVFWTFRGYKYYSMDDDGTLKSTDTMYKAYDTYLMELPILPKIPLEVEAVDPKTHKPIGKEVLPEGIPLYLYGTDRESFVEVMTGDMKHYRIPIQRDASRYVWTINGKDEGDCFDELYYAG